MSELNKQQKQAVDINQGPCLVVAGAGTGKTRVIVERIARLISESHNPNSILALTFTEKAAQEMRDRVGELLSGSYAIDLNIFTFNAFGQEILREFAIEAGRSSDVKILGDNGKIVLLREHIDELEMDYFAPVSNPDGQLGPISDYISKLKQQLISPDDYKAYANNLPQDNESSQLERIKHLELANIYNKYLEICDRRKVMDYDDQIFRLVNLLKLRPNILEKLQARYKFILVDEFQDTNPMQSELLDLLAIKHKNLMTVGDDDQSIYGWRGATLSNILNFTSKYHDAVEITLIDNYRSDQAILDVSHRLIQHNNPNRLEAINNLNKKLVSHKESKANAVNVESFEHIDQEIRWIANDIQQRINDGQHPGSIAILTRRNASINRIHEYLEYLKIDHVVAGISNDIYQQPIIGTLIETLKAVSDPTNNTAVYHALIGPLFKIDKILIANLAAQSRKEHSNLLELAKDHESIELKDASKKIQDWRMIQHELKVSELAYQILSESGLKDQLYQAAEKSAEDAFTVQVIGKWFSSLNDFESASTISSTINYLQNLEALKASGETISEDPTNLIDYNLPTLMSIHKSKGLEWETVYVFDCTEGSFPLRNNRSSLEIPAELQKTSDADDHLAEERRLMYVAMTRAKSELFLTYSKTHNGTTQRKPSRFLAEAFSEEFSNVTGHQTKENQLSLDLINHDVSNEDKISLPSSMINGNRVVLTASQANDFLRCPLDFFYRHILNVPSEDSPNSSVGTIFHNLIQKINDSLIAKKQPPSLQECLDELSEKWPSSGYLSAKQRDRAKLHAAKSFKESYQRIIAGPIPIASELPFSININDSNLTLKGRIDVILPTSKPGEIEIRDYKTSTQATNADKAKRSASSSKQLEMYALAWLYRSGSLPSVLSLDFLQTNQIGSVKKRLSTIENLEHKLASAADSISKREFERGKAHDYCRHP